MCDGFLAQLAGATLWLWATSVTIYDVTIASHLKNLTQCCGKKCSRAAFIRSYVDYMKKESLNQTSKSHSKTQYNNNINATITATIDSSTYASVMESK